MKTPDDDLITAAISAQPEQVNDALLRGADPFFTDQNGEFGYGALLRFAQIVQPGGPSGGLGERMRGAIHNMNQMPFRPETSPNAERFALFLEERASKSEHANQITLDMAKSKGIAINQTTQDYFQNNRDTDKFFMDEFKKSKIFAGVKAQMTDVERWEFDQKVLRAQERGESLALEEAKLMDMQADGSIAMRAQMRPSGPSVPKEAPAQQEQVDPELTAPRMTMARLRQSVETRRQDVAPEAPSRSLGVR